MGLRVTEAGDSEETEITIRCAESTTQDIVLFSRQDAATAARLWIFEQDVSVKGAGNY